ncbi:RagB/SusD family nutrient uptake outer membrane protein [Rapidithrix thailandica]|uniref:RagB/SusD family nutrient uptake outer membrane protein n=1 Tax=Rapidithrix thailandica TaxID=413964 RepID=A0AAW9SED1_9BACT
MKKYICIYMAIIVLNACTTDYLDVSPLNEVSDATFWKTEEDAELALAGCYNMWETWSNIIFLDAMSDNAYDQHFAWQLLGNGQFLPSTYFPNWYDSNTARWFLYTKIRKYNSFLIKIDGVEMDEDLKEQYKAEVRFLRAYDYFNKAMFYGDIPLVTKILPPDAIVARTPVAEVNQFILEELAEISTLLPAQNNIASGGHITAGAALALKARLELYLGMYEEAMEDAQKVIDMDYELYPDYRNLFLPGNGENNKEAILQINYIKNFIPNRFFPQLFMPRTEGGWSTLNGTKSLVDTYEMLSGKPIDDPTSGYDPDQPFANRDLRLAMTLNYTGQEWNGRYYNALDQFLPDGSKNPDYHNEGNASRAGMNIKKYIKPISLSDNQLYDVNVQVIRLAEMYLTYAEAAVELGKNTDYALTLINQLRDRGGLPPAANLTQALVRRERRVELALEGLRFFDIKRWDIGATALNGPVYGSPLGSLNYNTGEVTWSSELIKLEDRTFYPERNYLLPIPLYEIDVSGMTQNPGY